MRAMIAGGGTGGHVFPAIALAEALRDGGESTVLFVGTARGLESRTVPEAGFSLVTIPARRVRGGGLWRAAGGVAAALWAVAISWRAILRFRPDVVIGVGGYASAPMVVAARLLRVPTMLLEQNVIPGATNRVLARCARRVCVSFPETATAFAGTPVVCTGNPVRADILEVASARTEPSEGVDEKDCPMVLVVGGSAGAHHLNVEATEAIAKLTKGGKSLRVTHQTGAADAAAVEARYRSLGVHAEVVPFFGRIAAAYRAADIVIARAGATTIAECLVIGLPMILVPYPFAADDHQRRNAERVAAAGAAVLILDRELTAARLATDLAPLIEDPSRRRRMSASARALARPDASRRVARECAAIAAG